MSERVKKVTIKPILLAFCFALLPLVASATGLGKLSVFSALGEPLNAEIELLSVTPEELSSLTASLAPDEQYAAQGIDKTVIQRNIITGITQKPNGSIVIQLSTSDAVMDPFLDMLIQVAWTNGQLLREYTLLLDPAANGSTIASPSIEAPKAIVTQSSTKQTAISSDKPINTSRKANRSGHYLAKQDDGETLSDANKITTVQGDTLSAIVKRIQIQDVNLDQLLVGVYEANKSAFADDNMNRLKVGQVLSIPSAQVLQAISKDEAKTEVRAQVSNWHAYSTKLADAASYSARDLGISNGNSGKIVTKAEDKATPVEEGPRDVVKLAKTESGKQINADQSQSTAEPKTTELKVANLQDDLAAKQNAIKETDEKSAALEKQIADMKHLLAIENKNLSDAQKSADQAKLKTKDIIRILDNVSAKTWSVIGVLLATLILLYLWIRAKNRPQEVFENKTTQGAPLPVGEPSSDLISNDQGSTDDHLLVPTFSETESEGLSSEVKALEVDLADIKLSFDTAPQIDAPVAAAPIPDAFNGDFSNLLKVAVKTPQTKPKTPKSAAAKSTAAKSTVKSNKPKSDDNLTESASVATKLELAAAYIDMADKKGALILLREALSEGGPQQRLRAQSLIDSLA